MFSTLSRTARAGAVRGARLGLGTSLLARARSPRLAPVALGARTSSTGRRPIAVPTSPVPDCSPGDDALACPIPAGSEPLEKRHVPARRALLLFLLPIPPATWPSHLDVRSPLIAEAGSALKRAGVSVNAVWDGKGTASFPGLREPETYPARLLFPDGKAFEFPDFSDATLDSAQLRKALTYRPKLVGPAAAAGVKDEHGQVAREILVCTHGSRDCRCSDYGRPLVAALREELARRGDNTVHVREVGHVGGHKWAANALLLPSLDMLSNLRASDARALTDFVLAGTPVTRAGAGMWAHWRGRVGLTEDEQDGMWSGIEAALGSGAAAPAGQAGVSEANVSADAAAAARAKSKPHDAMSTPGHTVPITFRTFDGKPITIDAPVGATLLDIGKAHDLPALEGVCGGNAECATCHLYLTPRPSPAPVPEPSEDELDMLDFALDYRDGTSRLGCQVKVTPELAAWCADGGVIELPRF